MATQRAIDALLEFRKKRDQNSQEPIQLANAYNLNEPSTLADSLSQGIQPPTPKSEEQKKRI